MISIHTTFHQGLSKLSKSQLTEFRAWRESAGGYPAVTVECQVNAINSILAGQKPDNRHRESHVVKNNGAADNGGQEFRESTSDFTESGAEQDPVLSEAYKLCEQYVKYHGLSRSDAQRVVGLPSKTRSELKFSASQFRTFAKLVLAGKPERQAQLIVSDDN